MKYPIVYIEWDDSFTTTSWGDLEEVQKIERAKCLSVGFLVSETKKEITLAQSLGEEGGVNGSITVPRGCITKRHNYPVI